MLLERALVRVVELACWGCCRALLPGCCCLSDVCALEVACWYRCKVLLQGAAVRMLFALLIWLAAAAAGGGGGYCQTAARALELACWCRCRVLLQGAAWGAAEWRVRFGSRLLVPLQCYSGVCAFELAAGTAEGAAASGWCC